MIILFQSILEKIDFTDFSFDSSSPLHNTLPLPRFLSLFRCLSIIQQHLKRAHL